LTSLSAASSASVPQNLATLVDGQLVRLFHPRRDVWSDHFARHGDRILGLTAIGRGTVQLLDMNDDDRRQIRSASQTS
jgi:hypothetical protein